MRFRICDGGRVRPGLGQIQSAEAVSLEKKNEVREAARHKVFITKRTRLHSARGQTMQRRRKKPQPVRGPWQEISRETFEKRGRKDLNYRVFDEDFGSIFFFFIFPGPRRRCLRVWLFLKLDRLPDRPDSEARPWRRRKLKGTEQARLEGEDRERKKEE